MVITLVGLSGCGKSHLAKRLAKEKGFQYVGCDDRIEKKLVGSVGGITLDSITAVAEWLGEPYEPQYHERQAEYLRQEAEVAQEILDELGPDGWGLKEDRVIDTTGSVIYLNKPLLQGLKARSRIIYLAIPKNEYAQMYEQYFAEPKPVIWGSSYQAHADEAVEQTLRRCYPELIADRASRYQELAEMTMIMDRANRDRLSLTRFLQLAGAR